MQIISIKQAKKAIQEIKDRTEWTDNVIANKSFLPYKTVRNMAKGTARNHSDEKLQKLQKLYDYVIENTEDPET